MVSLPDPSCTSAFPLPDQHPPFHFLSTFLWLGPRMTTRITDLKHLEHMILLWALQSVSDTLGILCGEGVYGQEQILLVFYHLKNCFFLNQNFPNLLAHPVFAEIHCGGQQPAGYSTTGWPGSPDFLYSLSQSSFLFSMIACPRKPSSFIVM